MTADLRPHRRFSFRSMKRVAATDRILGSLAVMRRSFELGIEAPEEREDYRGAGVPLEW